jgi:hypothetical protein
MGDPMECTVCGAAGVCTVLQGTVRRDLRGVENWLKRSVLINWKTASLYYLILKGHHHKRRKNYFQRLNNILHWSWLDVITLFCTWWSPYIQFRNQAYAGWWMYGTSLVPYIHQPVQMSDNQLNSIKVRYSPAPHNHTTVQGCTVPSSAGAGAILYLVSLSS